MKRASMDRWSHPITLHFQPTKAAELHQLTMMKYHIASSSQKSTSKEDSATKEASNLNQEEFSMVDKEDNDNNNNKDQNRNRQIIRQKKETLSSKFNLTHHYNL